MDEVDEIRASPIVTLDFETTGLIAYKCLPVGGSVAWMRPCGEKAVKYWSFDFLPHGKNKVSWRWFNERVLSSFWDYPDKTLVMHNAAYDLQVAMRRRFPYPLQPEQITACLPKCKVEDTMVMSFLVDENVPRSLKELSRLLLGKPRKTYEQTKAEIQGEIKEGERRIKEFLKLGWNLYQMMNTAGRGGDLFSAVEFEEDFPFAEKFSAFPVQSYQEFRKKFMEEVGEVDLLGRVWWHLCHRHCSRRDSFTSMIREMPSGLAAEEVAGRLETIIAPRIRKYHQDISDAKFCAYGAEDAMDTLEIYPILKEKLEQDPRALKWYREVELPFALLMVHTEIGGFPVDVELLSTMERDGKALLDLRMDTLSKRVEREFGIKEFNPRSGDQIKNLLWERLKLKAPEWAKKRQKGPATDAEVLNYLAGQGNSLAKELVKVAGISKLYGTYFKSFLEFVLDDDAHRVRTKFNTVGPVTGRVSSSDPNLQNIPRPDKMPTVSLEEYAQMRGERVSPEDKAPFGWKWSKNGKDSLTMESLRNVFVAPRGYKLIVADYSQIELRAIAHIVAHISTDTTLADAYRGWDCECGAYGRIEVAKHWCPSCGVGDGERDVLSPEQKVIRGFCLGKDIHSLAGLNVGLIEKYGPKEGRQKAKEVNFGLWYGETPPTLARALNITVEEAKIYHEAYYRFFPGVSLYHKWAEDRLLQSGEFSMISGRRRRFHAQRELATKKLLKKKELRKVLRDIFNNLPQGSASDAMKKGVTTFMQHKMDVKDLQHIHFALQVHDEVIVLVREEAVERCLPILRDDLELTSRWRVPILVECKVCDVWGKGK